MTRIPFRALGRPLSGKNGRFNRVGTPAPVVEPAPEPEVAAVSELEPEPQVEAVSEPEPVAPPEWEPTWTKAQLLVVAQSKGLSVTAANTKADIVAALTAAG